MNLDNQYNIEITFEMTIKKNLMITLIIFHFSNHLNAKDIIEEKKCNSYEEYINKAKMEWPNVKAIILTDSIRESFIAGYNNMKKEGKELDADIITVFPMHNSSNIFFLAGKENCFNFWVSIDSDRLQEILDGGHLAKDDNRWRNKSLE